MVKIKSVNLGFAKEKALNNLGINIDCHQNISFCELKSNPLTTLYLPFVPRVDYCNDLVFLNKANIGLNLAGENSLTRLSALPIF